MRDRSSVLLLSFRFSLNRFALHRSGFLAALLFGLSASVMPAQDAPLQVMHHHVRREVTDHRAALRGHLAEDKQLHLSVILPLRNQSALSSLLQRLYDPSSPDYRHFLSVAQFTDQFGPAESDYAAVAKYLRSYGLKTEDAPANRLVVSVSGSAAQVNAAFNVQMNVYQHPTEDRTFFSPDREPSLHLSVPIAHVTGLDNFSIPKHFSHRAAADQQQPLAVNGSGPGSSYLGSDMRAAYYGGTTLDGTGQSVGLLEFNGYNPSDVTMTFTNAGQSTNVPINNVLIDGASAGAFGTDGEQVLDIVQAIGMAPGLSQVRVYIGIGDDDSNILNSMTSENIAKQLSCSWGWMPADPTADDVFFQEMAAQGQSFFTASGDAGAFDFAISPYFYPAEDQYVTTVGGTHLTTTGAAGSWVSETVWNSGSDGSGGGISPDGIAQPSYQNGLANSANGGSTTLRNVPDLAMEGDFDNYSCQLGACNGDWAGTSFATPRWAGFMALVNQQAVEAGSVPSGGGIGFINPAIYQIAQGANAGKDLHDVTSGNNDTRNQPLWFSATPGYDLTTGWGSANGQSLIDDLAGPQVPGFWLSSSQGSVNVNPGGSGSTTIKITDAGKFTGAVNLALSSPLPAGVTANFASASATATDVLTFNVDSSVAAQNIPVTITGTSGSLTQSASLTLSIHTATFALLASPNSVTVNPGKSITTQVYVEPEYGFTGSASLSVSGLPSGVTASFSPASTSGSSVLTLTASSAAVGSTGTLTITGTSGSLSATTTLRLSVLAPTFQINTSQPVSVGQGSTASSFLQVIAENGFSGSVNLTATNLPAGVTASFSPNPTTGTTTVTFTAAATAAVGSTTVTITGTSGSISSSSTLQVSVMAPTFTLTSSGSGTVGQGGETPISVFINSQYGFNGNVSMSIAGLPSGVTAVWGVNPVPVPPSSYSTAGSLYFYAASSAQPGTYPLTITGTSGGIVATTTYSLTVAAPSFTIPTFNTVTLGQGTTSSFYNYIQRLYGFNGTVNFSASGLPAGVTAFFNPASISGSNTSLDFSLQASPTAVPGQYPITITGTSGSLVVNTSLTLVVATPGFTLSTFGNVTAGQGTSASSYVYVQDQNGFTGNVSLSASGLPSGVTATFATNPTSYTSQITFTVGAGVLSGQYPITITGTSGSLTQATTMTLVVAPAGFTLSVPSVSIGQGQSSSTSIFVSETNGFNSPVTLSVTGLPNGVTSSFVTNPTTYYSQLNLVVASTVSVGQYPFTVTGVSGSLTQSVTGTLTVAAPSFFLSASSPYIGQGSSGTGYAYVYGQNGFNSPVTLSLSGLPSGVTASFSTNPTTNSSNINFNVSSSAAIGTSALTLTGTSGTATETSALQLTVVAPSFSLYGPYNLTLNQGATTSSSITLQSQYGFAGNVTLSATGLPSGVTANFSPNPTTGTSTITLTAAANATPGTATFTITGTSGSVTASTQVQVTVNAASFALAAAPGEVTVAPGAAGNANLYIVPANGFAGAVALAASGLPAGVTASFSPANATTSSTLTLTADNTAAAGHSTVTITGTSGAETSTASLLLNITGSAATAKTTTTLTLSNNGSPVTTTTSGSMITATASVVSGSSPVKAGQVYLCDATAASCDSAHQLAVAQLQSSGSAVFHFVPGVGAHSYVAAFAATSVHAASVSAAVPLTVTVSLPTTTALTESGAAGNYTLTATVTSQGVPVPTGSVSFLDTTANNFVLNKLAIVSSGPTLTETVTPTPSLGYNPTYSVSGDFNGDGLSDLAIVGSSNSGSSSTSTLSILLANGTGGFTAGSTLTMSSTAGLMVTGDFNHDGNLDLAVLQPQSTGSTVAIYLGNGDGTFTASTSPVYTPPNPNNVVAADFNGDGLVDLAVTSQAADSVTILLGNGDGTFAAAPGVPSAGGYPTALAQGDFNGDGVPDLAIGLNSSNAGNIMILLGNGDGSFTASPAISAKGSPSALAVGDFNQDGKTDLAVSGSGIYLAVFLGHGDSTFTATPVTYAGSTPSSIAVADINSDGKQDIVVADAFSYKVTTLLGGGDGTFITGPVETSTLPQNVVVGDWNGDGQTDIAVTSSYVSTLTVYTTQQAQKVVATANGFSPEGTGQHTVDAVYSGDANFAASTSNTVSLTAGLDPPIVTVNPSLSSLNVTQPLVVTVSVATLYGYAAPTGTVALTSGSYSLPAAAINNGSATFNIPAGALPVGSDTLTANFVPDTASASNYTSSTGTATVKVSLLAPVVSWSTPAAITYGTALSSAQLNATANVAGTFAYSPAAGAILTAGQQNLSVTFTPTNAAVYQTTKSTVILTVTPASTTTAITFSAQNLSLSATVSSASGMPTGTVTFYAGQTSLGTAAMSTSGVAGVTLKSFPTTGALTARYSGDSNFIASTSAPMYAVAMSASSASLTVSTSGTVTDSFTATAPTGYSGTLQFTCTGLPQNASCSFGPSSLTLSSGVSTGTTVMSVNTGSHASLQSAPDFGRGDHTVRWATALALPGLLALLGLRRRRKLSTWIRSASLLLVAGSAAFWLGGCAGGSTSSTSSTPATASAPSGSYTLQVTATGSSGVVQIVPVTLVVQ